jgi:YVTN family beta-propeller protein
VLNLVLASRRFAFRGALVLGALLGIVTPAPVLANFVNFESHQIHPIGISPDGTRLAALNTPDGYLCIYQLGGVVPLLQYQIPVGLEPVSLAWWNNDEIWVANHLSDDVSIVDLTTQNVRATLLVGDEPTDVIFAGNPVRAYVCVSQEDVVKVYDPLNLATLPIVIPIFGADPRALAKSRFNDRVYVTVFESGNRTTILPETTVVAHGGQPPPSPAMDPMLPPAPASGLIVQFNGSDWIDDTGGIWTPYVNYSVADNDVAVIDAVAPVPGVIGYHTGVGTLNYDISVNPVTDQIYVTNTDARNLIRFENNLNANFSRQRVTVINPSIPTVTPVQLNPHVNYAVTPGSQAEIDMSLATPMDMEWNATGTLMYMTALGSGKVAVLNSAGVVVERWDVAEGPTGLALDEARNLLYVLDRFANQIKVVSTVSGIAAHQAGLGFNPEPPEVRNGRKFLYSAKLTSGHGDASCATCHPFANFDHLAWDLGRPDGAFLPAPGGQNDTLLTGFHPMKGPMMTQSLRGLLFTEPYHQRGDRGDFFEFNVAFTDLMGAASTLSGADMSAFNDFIQTVTYPPNPKQKLDRTFFNPAIQPSAQRGKNAFSTIHLDDGKFCVECHNFPTGTDNQIISGQVMGNSQDLNTSQLRNLYEKTGFQKTGTAKSGFGFIHNGSFETIFAFFQQPFFTFGVSNVLRRDMEAFMLAWDTDLAPAVGAQQTIDGANKNNPAVVARIDTLITQADFGNADLQVKGRVGGIARGYRYAGGDLFEPDRVLESYVHKDTLRSWATSGGELTYTGLPLGCGMRAVDRDLDGFRDRDELDIGSDPADPLSTPATGSVIGGPGEDRLLGGKVRLLQSRPNPTRGTPSQIEFELAQPTHVTLRIYDTQGRVVRTLIDGVKNGLVETTWDLRNEEGRSMPSGVYFYRLEGNSFIETRRLTILK